MTQHRADGRKSILVDGFLVAGSTQWSFPGSISNGRQDGKKKGCEGLFFIGTSEAFLFGCSFMG